MISFAAHFTISLPHILEWGCARRKRTIYKRTQTSYNRTRLRGLRMLDEIEKNAQHPNAFIKSLAQYNIQMRRLCFRSLSLSFSIINFQFFLLPSCASSLARHVRSSRCGGINICITMPPPHTVLLEQLFRFHIHSSLLANSGMRSSKYTHSRAHIFFSPDRSAGSHLAFVFFSFFGDVVRSLFYCFTQMRLVNITLSVRMSDISLWLRPFQLDLATVQRLPRGGGGAKPDG